MRNDTLYYADNLTYYRGKEIIFNKGTRSDSDFRFTYRMINTFKVKEVRQLDEKWAGKKAAIYKIVKADADLINPIQQYFLVYQDRNIEYYQSDILNSLISGEITDADYKPGVTDISAARIAYGYNPYDVLYKDTYRLFLYERGGILYASTGMQITKGSTIKLGRGSLPNGDYKFINIEKDKGQFYEQKSFEVTEVNVTGTRKKKKYYIYILDGKDVYKCDVEGALQSGELIAR